MCSPGGGGSLCGRHLMSILSGDVAANHELLDLVMNVYHDGRGRRAAEVLGIACRRRGGAALAAAARAPQPAPPHPALPERERRPLMTDPWVHRPQAIVASMLGVSWVVRSSIRCCYGIQTAPLMEVKHCGSPSRATSQLALLRHEVQKSFPPAF